MLHLATWKCGALCLSRRTVGVQLWAPRNSSSIRWSTILWIHPCAVHRRGNASGSPSVPGRDVISPGKDQHCVEGAFDRRITGIIFSIMYESWFACAVFIYHSVGRRLRSERQSAFKLKHTEQTFQTWNHQIRNVAFFQNKHSTERPPDVFWRQIQLTIPVPPSFYPIFLFFFLEGSVFRCTASSFGWKKSVYWFVKVMLPFARHIRENMG